MMPSTRLEELDDRDNTMACLSASGKRKESRKRRGKCVWQIRGVSMISKRSLRGPLGKEVRRMNVRNLLAHHLARQLLRITENRHMIQAEQCPVLLEHVIISL